MAYFKKGKNRADVANYRLDQEELKNYGIQLTDIRHELRASAVQLGVCGQIKDDEYN